jgi:hypothetical protein
MKKQLGTIQRAARGRPLRADRQREGSSCAAWISERVEPRRVSPDRLAGPPSDPRRDLGTKGAAAGEFDMGSE